MTKPTTGDRVAALEEGYKSLGREIHALREDFSLFAKDMRGQVQAQSRVQWGPIMSAAGVIVAVIGGLITLGSSGPLRDLGRHDLAIQRMADQVAGIRETRFSKADGQELYERATSRVERLDAALQREMRDLDRVSETRIDQLDKVLQREMRLLVAPLEARIGGLERRVEGHQSDGHPHSVRERVEGLRSRVEAQEDRK